MADVSIETTIATSRVPIVVYLGTIPSKAEFKLDFYIMAKRFSMLSEAVKEAFESFCQQLCLDSSTHRFFVTSEDDNTPLDFTLPVGVLFDMFATELPWSLRLHITQKLNPKVFDYSTCLKFLNTRIKESHFIRCGKRLPGLSNEHETLIWGVANSQSEGSVVQSFWRCMEELYPELGAIQRLPIKLVVPPGTAIPLYLSTSSQPPSSSSSSSSLPSDSSPAPSDDVIRTFGDLARARQIPQVYREKIGRTHTLIVHGVIPSPETPLVWMVKHFCYADGFVYVVMAELGKQVSTE